MGYSQTITKLSLAEFARIMGIHPLHFWGVALEATANAICSDTVRQHEWQGSDRVSREEIARAIADAEFDLETALGYRLRPDWEYDEWQRTTSPYRPELVTLNNRTIAGYQQAVKSDWGHAITGGVKASSVIEAGATITWSDSDGDGYQETGTVSVSTSVTEAEEIHVYYPGKSGDARYEIRPIQASIAGGTATITFRRELTVKEDLIEALKPTDVNGADDANFLATVDVYRIYNDPSTQATLVWEPAGWCDTCGTLGAVDCPSCGWTVQTGCILPQHRELGIWQYQPAEWDADNEVMNPLKLSVGRQPEAVRLFYRAGYRNQSLSLPDRTMDPAFARMVAQLAAARLSRQMCGCSAEVFQLWQEDMSATRSVEQKTLHSIGDRGTMGMWHFGFRRGEVETWLALRRSRRLTGGSTAVATR